MTIFPRIVELLREQEAADIKLFGGGVIPSKDVKALKEIGVAELFLQDSPTQDTVHWIRTAHKPQPAGTAA
jgi:methylmalonyl-CoA mutase C-terminal domain/subunit